MISSQHLPETERAYDWRQDAACLDEDPDLMYPNPGDTIGIDDAKAVCARCPVRLECQQRSLDRGEPYGVWGGLDETERAELLGRRRKTDPDAPRITQQVAPCGTPGAYRRHLRRGEPADEACRRAYSLEQAEKRHRAKKQKVPP